jgi:acyl carrier protein
VTAESAAARARAAGVSHEEFTAAVAKFVAQRSGFETREIGPHFDYVSSGVLDSISVIDLFFFVEDTFGGRFQPDDFDVRKVNTAAKLYEHFFSTAAQRFQELS